ncbi:MAG: TetR/AcrR family transcriptional regulator [Frankia sp.]
MPAMTGGLRPAPEVWGPPSGLSTAPAGGCPSGLADARRRRRADDPREREILVAALELLATVGYDRMSMDAVASRARAGKATLYRRWACKPDLVVDAMRYLLDGGTPVTDTGDLRTDLLAVATATREVLSGDLGAVARGVLGELRHNPQLRAALRATFTDEGSGGLRGVLDRAVERGEIAPTTDVGFVAETGFALLMMRLLVSGQPVEDADLERLVDHVLIPAAHAPPR